MGKKEVRINLKINSLLREEFQAASHLRGGTMSSLLHQYIVKVVREEKERSAEEFAKALEHVRTINAAEAGREAAVRMPEEDFESLHEEVSKKPGAATARRRTGNRKK